LAALFLSISPVTGTNPCGSGEVAYLRYNDDQQSWLVTDRISAVSDPSSMIASAVGTALLKVDDERRDIFLPALNLFTFSRCGANGGRLVPEHALIVNMNLTGRAALARAAQDWTPWQASTA
jgi:hypothetical protein